MKGKTAYRFRPTIRMTEEEHRELARRAKQAGLSLARYLVESGLRDSAPNQQERNLRSQELLQKEWATNQLARIGNNLNQAVHRLHMMTGTVTYTRLNDMLKDLSETLGFFKGTWRVRSSNGGSGK